MSIRIDAKKKLVKEVFVALDEAYRVPDARIFLREWPLEQVSQDGRLDSAPTKPVAFLEVPPSIRLDVKRQMLKRINPAIADAYRLPDILIFMREYPLDMVSQDGGLQSENPIILDALEKSGEDVAMRGPMTITGAASKGSGPMNLRPACGQYL